MIEGIWNEHIEQFDIIIMSIWSNIVEANLEDALKFFAELINEIEKTNQQFPIESKELVEKFLTILTQVEKNIKGKNYMEMADILYYKLRPMLSKYRV